MTRRTPTKRTIKQWNTILQEHASYSGSTAQFCREHQIPVQTFYAQLRKRSLSNANISQQEDKLPQETSAFISAKVEPALATPMVLQMPNLQLTLPSQCEPAWLAALLNELNP